MAVQNSELLKRLTVVTSFAAESGRKESSIPTLIAAVESISPLHSFLHEAGDSLRWSMDFHKNYLFGKKHHIARIKSSTLLHFFNYTVGEPPTHKKVATVSEGGPPTTAHPLEATVSEVHCMDLKTQVALQRYKNLGTIECSIHLLPPIFCTE